MLKLMDSMYHLSASISNNFGLELTIKKALDKILSEIVKTVDGIKALKHLGLNSFYRH